MNKLTGAYTTSSVQSNSNRLFHYYDEIQRQFTNTCNQVKFTFKCEFTLKTNTLY